MYIPELVLGLEWLKMDVFYVLTMGTVNRNGCRLNHVWLAILHGYQ